MTAGGGRAAAQLRAAALAAVALLAIGPALLLAHRSPHRTGLPVVAPRWTKALAAPYVAGRTIGSCGIPIDATTLGVAHPQLPCGVKLTIEFRGRRVSTRVIDRGHVVPGRLFDLTQALAARLGLQGTQTIRWRFSR